MHFVLLYSRPSEYSLNYSLHICLFVSLPKFLATAHNHYSSPISVFVLQNDSKDSTGNLNPFNKTQKKKLIKRHV